MGDVLLNTHFYDGKIEECYKGILVSKKDNVPAEKIVENLMKMYGSGPLESPLRASLEALASNSGNYDSTDHIDARELFFVCYEKILEIFPDGKVDSYIFEQISDIMISGPCPQGRSKRMFQLYMCLCEANQQTAKNT
jgi:hypothetical protein